MEKGPGEMARRGAGSERVGAGVRRGRGKGAGRRVVHLDAESDG